MGGLGVVMGLLKKAGSVLLIGLIIISLAIWLIPDSVLGQQAKMIKMMLIGLVVVFMLIVFIMQKMMMATKGSKKLEGSMTTPTGTAAAVRPDKKQEIELLKARMNEAIAALKASKVAKGKSGSHALYALPWYVIVGPPGSGKSTAIAKSELNFPYLDPSGKGIRGVGGTRNCDWWFTSEAIILDTAGRYTTESEDREEWLAFLDQLKKYRPRKPINGVIVAVAISDLMNATDDQITEHARTIRARIDELINRLGITFPVYILFTKCDLLDGFVETFDELRKAERAQVWGTSFPASGEERPARTLFDKEFDKLARALEDYRSVRLAAETKPETRQKIYLFPLEFRSAQESLADFIGMVFQANPYQEQPLFRGFYFSSGTQEGTPLEIVMSKLMDTFRLPAPLQAAQAERGEVKSYFIHDLFEKIIFPDQGLAGPSVKGVRKESRMRTYFALGTAAVCLLWLLGAIFSFIGNSAKIASAKEVITPVASMEARSGAVLENLRTLDSLRSMLEQLETSGKPFMRRFGLYQGDEIAEGARALYFQKFTSLFIQQAGTDLVAKLRAPEEYNVNSVQEYYALVRTYLILTRPQKADSNVIIQSFSQLAQQEVSPENEVELRDLVTRQVQYFWKHRQTVKVMPSDEYALKKAREHLAANLTPEIYLDARISAFAAGTPAISLRQLQVDTQLLQSSASVRGGYTEAGWPRLKEPIGFTGIDKMQDWVIDNLYDGDPQTLRALKTKVYTPLRTLYIEKLAGEWLRFLGTTAVNLPSDPEQKAAALNTAISDRGIKRLLQAADRASKPNGLDTIFQKQLDEKVTIVRDCFGRPATETDPGSDGWWGGYHARIKALSDACAAVKQDPVAGMKDYRKAEALAKQEVDRILRNYPYELQESVASLLRGPLGGGIDKPSVEGEGGGGGGGGGDKFYSTLATKYPFTRGSSEDAPLNDVVNYFHPQSGEFWTSYYKKYEPLVDPSGVKKKDAEDVTIPDRAVPAIRRARSITDALFPAGNPSTKVDFQIYPNTPVGATGQLKAITFAFADQRKTYQFGPQRWESVSWPSDQSGGAYIRVEDKNGAIAFENKIDGPWALFRLLDSSARREPISDVESQYEWEFEYPKSSGQMVKVSWKIRATTSRHPFQSGFFSDFRP